MLRGMSADATAPRRHPRVEFDRWAAEFPLSSFERPEAPESHRHFDSAPPGDPLDLRKAEGRSVTGPAQLCEIELARRRVVDGLPPGALGREVPVDVILWSLGPPAAPHLTRLGGVPHREADRPWPTGADGEPATFVAQYCFLDSAEVAAGPRGGDLLLVFFRHEEGHFDPPGGIVTEWSDIELKRPATAADCPEPGFPVPPLSGVLHRTVQYPDMAAWDAFKAAGHYQHYLFPAMQASLIGREAFFIQNDLRGEGRELLCTLNSLSPIGRWPLLGREAEPTDEECRWGIFGLPFTMSFGDVGCVYFLIDRDGTVTYDATCY